MIFSALIAQVTIEPRPPKGFNYRIIYEAFKKNPEAVNNTVPAYDGHKSLYTAKPISDKQVEMDVLLSEGEDGGTPSTSLLISSLLFAILFVFFTVILKFMYFD